MAIKQFDTQWLEFSNFAFTRFMYKGIEYPTAEHAYQCQKVENEVERLIVLDSPTPAEAKMRANRFKRVKDWDKIKRQIMIEVVHTKFSTSPYLKQQLISTGHEHLEEGNTWGDKFWGTVDGVGENMLGRILMEVRTELQKE